MWLRTTGSSWHKGQFWLRYVARASCTGHCGRRPILVGRLISRTTGRRQVLHHCCWCHHGVIVVIVVICCIAGVIVSSSTIRYRQARRQVLQKGRSREFRGPGIKQMVTMASPTAIIHKNDPGIKANMRDIAGSNRMA